MACLGKQGQYPKATGTRTEKDARAQTAKYSSHATLAGPKRQSGAEEWKPLLPSRHVTSSDDCHGYARTKTGTGRRSHDVAFGRRESDGGDVGPLSALCGVGHAGRYRCWPSEVVRAAGVVLFFEEGGGGLGARGSQGWSRLGGVDNRAHAYEKGTKSPC
jgi:hypothetical protein